MTHIRTAIRLFVLTGILQSFSAVSPNLASAEEAFEGAGFIETFESLDSWYVANFDRNDGFNTSWRRSLVSIHAPDARIAGAGTLRLRLEPAPETVPTDFVGAELQRRGPFLYGRYEVVMQAGKGDGLVSAFFTYTGPHFDDPHDEIDFEFLGRDTSRVWLNIFTDGDNLPGRWIDLGFDAATAPHLYRFDWAPDSVTWYVDGAEVMKVTADEHPIPRTPGKIFLDIWAATKAMHTWLRPPSDDLSAEAHFHCVSYRPFDAEGPHCADLVRQAPDG